MSASRPRSTRKSRSQILILMKTFGGLFLRFARSLFFAGYLNKFSDPMSIKAEIRSAAAHCCFLSQGLRIYG